LVVRVVEAYTKVGGKDYDMTVVESKEYVEQHMGEVSHDVFVLYTKVKELEARVDMADAKLSVVMAELYTAQMLLLDKLEGSEASAVDYASFMAKIINAGEENGQGIL
jgi:hypothetical protein